MAQFYIYLISSLPVLQFGLKAPFSKEHFFQMCSEMIPEKDMSVLNNADIAGLFFEDLKQNTLQQWLDFEITLRNELVKIRAARKKVEPGKYLKKDGLSDINLHAIAMHAHRMSSLVEAEKYLDLERWKKLDELCTGHYFDLDYLIIYAVKLQILIRWDNINKADKVKQLDRVLLTDSV